MAPAQQILDQEIRVKARDAFHTAVEARARDLANDRVALARVAERLFGEIVPFDQIPARCEEKIAYCLSRRHHWSYRPSGYLIHMTAIELRRAVEIVASRREAA